MPLPGRLKGGWGWQRLASTPQAFPPIHRLPPHLPSLTQFLFPFPSPFLSPFLASLLASGLPVLPFHPLGSAHEVLTRDDAEEAAIL